MTSKPAARHVRWRCGDRVITCGVRPLIMGILNVTPDSFSDGGRYTDTDKAVAYGLEMIQEGAEIIDVGGESTRPGAAAVSAKEEIRRVIPVVERLCDEIGRRRNTKDKLGGVVVSIDTMKAEVAQRAVAVGAKIINDVSALTSDPRMIEVAGEAGAGVVLMHMRGNPRVMQNNPRYNDVVAEVGDYLKSRIKYATKQGLELETLAVDPGIGFGKTVQHNVRLLRQLDILRSCGRPVVVGLSRKSFLGKLTGREVGDRLAASIAALSFCVMKGAHVMRVHDVRDSVDAVRVVTALGKEKAGWN